MTGWTGILAEIAEIAGGAAAMQVADAKGGLEKIHFPLAENLHANHWLVKAVGMDKAVAIARRLGGEKRDVPLGPFAGLRNRTRAAIRENLAAGLSPAEAARAAGVHQRTARRHRNNREPAETMQFALPLNGR